MTKKILPTPEQLRELLTYDPETGKLFWKPRDVSYFERTSRPEANLKSWNKRFLGKEAFTYLSSDGYRISAIFGRYIRAHRAAWAIHHGEWPSGEIDHINGVRDDNRLINIRDCKHHENMRNGLIRSNNKSGFKGVSWDEEAGKWRAQICYAGKKKSLGRFCSENEAHDAYFAAAIKHHGEFARFG